MISDLYPPDRRTTAFALFTMGLYVGVAAGYLFGGQFGDEIGWRSALILAGLPGLLLALLLRVTVAEPVRGQWGEKLEVPRSFLEAFATLASQPKYWIVTLATTAGGFVSYGTGNFNPSYLMRSHGLDLATTGTILAVTSSGSGILGTWLGGVLADRLGSRNSEWYLRICVIGQGLSVPFSVMAYLSSSLPGVLAALFLSHTLAVFMLAPSVAVVQGMTSPNMRALASSVFFFVINIVGLGLGPLTVGFLSDALTLQFGMQGLRLAQVAASGVSLISAALFAIAIVRDRKARATQTTLA